MDWFHQERDETDKRIEQLRRAGDAEGSKGVMIEAAVVSGQSNRELAAATITASETIDLVLRQTAEQLTKATSTLATRIDAATAATTASTDELARRTKHLVWATVFLGFAAIVAAAVQAYVIWVSPAQVIGIGRP
jgi:hypothetical protein